MKMRWEAPQILYDADKGGGGEGGSLSKERISPIETARVMIMRMPTYEEILADLQKGRWPELRVVLGRKSGKSRYANRLTLIGGKVEEGEAPEEVVKRKAGEEVKVFHWLSMRGLGGYEYDLPNGDKRYMRVFMGFVPSFDIPYPVDDKEAKIGSIEKMSVSEFLGDQKREEMLEYLQNMEEWDGDVKRWLEMVQHLFELHVSNIDVDENVPLEERAKRIHGELLAWEAKEYLKQYKDDEVRFAGAYFALMFANGVSLWEKRLEFLEVIEDEQVKARLAQFVDFIDKLREGERIEWEGAKQELQKLGLWTGNISGLDLKQSVDRFIQRLVEVVEEYYGRSDIDDEVVVDVNVVNEVWSYHPYGLASKMGDEERDIRQRFEVARWWGIFYGMMRVRSIYEERVSEVPDEFIDFLEKSLPRTDERVDWGDRDKPTVREYTMSDGRKVRVVWVGGREKTFESFFRKVLTVGMDQVDSIRDVWRMSIVVLDPELASDFYKDLVTRMEKEGFKWGSKRGEVGKVRNQLDLSGDQQGEKEERPGSIAGGFVEAKGYVWREEAGKKVKFLELAVWGLPYSSEEAKAGKIDFQQPRLGFLEKRIDDRNYHFWRLLTLFAYLFPDPIYGEVIGRLISMRIGRVMAD